LGHEDVATIYEASRGAILASGSITFPVPSEISFPQASLLRRTSDGNSLDCVLSCPEPVRIPASSGLFSWQAFIDVAI